MTPAQVLVLAGGEGRRFWPITTSKPLVEFLGESLLVHTLTHLKQAGFTQAVIVTNPQSHVDIAALNIPGFSLQTAVQAQPRGMADAILSATKLITNAPLLIVNATDVVDQSLYHQAYQKLHQGVNFTVGKKVERYFPAGYLKLTHHRPMAIIEKPGTGNQPSNLVKLVFDGFRKPDVILSSLKTIPGSRDDSYEQALTQLFNQLDFSLIRYHGSWQATKYPWHILEVMRLFLAGIKPRVSAKASISSTAVIEGNVIIEDQVRVLENAVIKGPVYIGRDTIVGNNALVRQSHLGDKCVVGFNTEVARSWVGSDSWFHSNYVGDSVLEANVSLGAGTILANLRLDEQEIKSVVKGEKIATGSHKLGAIIGRNVRIGVNTSIMPGVKVGPGSFVGAGLTLDQDIPENSFVAGKVNLAITPNRGKLNPSARRDFTSKL